MQTFQEGSKKLVSMSITLPTKRILLGTVVKQGAHFYCDWPGGSISFATNLIDHFW